jgi:hypothetical protein
VERINVRDNYELTRAIQVVVQTEQYRGQEILPLVSAVRRRFKVKIRNLTNPWGIGQFKAPNGDTPMAEWAGGLTQEALYVSAVDLEEMILLAETNLLESADALVAADAIDDLITVGRMLQIRNERLTEKMRWDALANNLGIQFQDGTQVSVDQYGDYAATHLIASNSNPWSVVASSDPASDIRGWADVLEEDAGVPCAHVWMNRTTFRRLQNSASWATKLSYTDRPYKIPTDRDLAAIIDPPMEIVIYNGSYKDKSGTKVKWIPDGYILMTTAYQIDGVNIGEMYDCPVVRAVDGRLVVANNPGMEAEIIVNELKKQEYLRVATARMPILLFPQNFMWINTEA